MKLYGQVMKCEKKSVLLFAPHFFDYDDRICQAMQRVGYNVELVNTNPSDGFIGKVCVRYNLNLYRPVITKYIKSIIAKYADKQFDHIVVIKGEGITKNALTLLRKAYPKAYFTLYLWDSVANIPECEKRMRLYDRVLTFDPDDSKTYGLIFRPLFAGQDYMEEMVKCSKLEYDFSFIGTAHTIRPYIVKMLGKECLEKGGKYFSFLFLPHPLVFVYNKIFNKYYRGIKKSDINFVSMNAMEIKEIYEKSRCILDVEHYNQCGLTMRTIELVGMQKKLITTNKSIVDYDFYNPNNIFVINRDDPKVSPSFWNSEYIPIPKDILQQYSIESFVKALLDVEGN